MSDYALYRYYGRHKNGEKVSGKIVAKDDEEAVSILKNRGIYVTKLKKTNPFFLKFSGIPDSQLALFFDGLSRMIKVGIEWKVALDNLIKEQFNPKVTLGLYKMKNAIEEGASIPEAFEAAGIFEEEVPFIIRAGVESGKLTDVLASLKEYYEQRHKIKKSVKSALAYPVFLLLGVIGVVLFLAPRIVNSIKKVYDQIGNMELPAFTIFVMNTIDFLVKYSPLIALFIGASIYFFRRAYAKNPKFKRFVDALVLKTPVLGTFVKKLAVYRFVLSLSILYKAGVPFNSALKMVIDMQKNDLIREDFSRIKEMIDNGAGFSKAVKVSRYIPDMAKTVLAIGESSGQLSQQLDSLKEYMRMSFEEYIDKMTKIFEPLSIAIIGGIVLSIVGAIYLPFIDMMDAFKNMK